MCHRFFKYGSLQRGVIGMCIKMVPANVGKIHNVSFGNSTFMRNDGISDLQLFKVFSEWMFFFFAGLCAGLIYIGNSSDGSWRSLQGDALHIVMNAPDAPHFFPAAGTPRSAMHQ